MKKLILACTLMLSNILFANESIPTQHQSVQIEISDDKEIDRLFTNFGTIPVGSFNYVNYYVTNTGNQPLFFRDARIYGANYYARHNCKSLAPRGRCTFTIEYSPFYEGWHTGQFTLSLDPGYMVVVDLQGNAIRY